MGAPYPPVVPQLETALLITLRDTMRWESALDPVSSSGTYSGTLVPVATQQAPFDARQYQQRDRELAWLDTRNAAAVVQVALEVSSAWNTPALSPQLQGPQLAHVNYSPSDTSALGLTSKVVHVTNASLPLDAIAVDRDLCGRDLLVYDTLYEACRNLFRPSPLETPFQDKDGVVTSSGPLAPVTAWSLANGTERAADLATALPLNRDLFRDPDVNLADRDNQMAAYVANLCQMLKSPFAYANRLYVAVNGLDAREVEVYTLIFPMFVAGVLYQEGDEIYYQGTCYRVKAGVGSTSDVPWTSPASWETTATPSLRTWACEPSLPGRNRFVYNVVSTAIRWIMEGGTAAHVPQLVAMSVPGVFSGQTLETLAQVPGRKDGQFWRNKAARIILAGGTVTDIDTVTNVASWRSYGFEPQITGASINVPCRGTVHFPDVTTSVYPRTLSPGGYRAYALVEPNSTLELQGAANTLSQVGTLGGATFGAHGALSWNVGLPPAQWTVEFDYTNLTNTTDGFSIRADLGGALVFDNTSPFYFSDYQGNPLPNGQLVTSLPFPLYPSGNLQPFTLDWTGGNGNLHVRTLRFKTYSYDQGRYKITGTLAGYAASADVIGLDRQPDVITWDFNVVNPGSSELGLQFEKDAQLPLRLHQVTLAALGTNSPTPNSRGFEPFHQDCLVRAARSAQQAYVEAWSSGTAPVFMSAGSSWGTEASERWMAFIETAEPRLRQRDNVPSGALIEGRDYQAKLQPITYGPNVIVPDQVFHADATSTYAWVSTAGTVNQVGAWIKSRPSHVGRPGLAPAGVYFDTNGGTVAVAYGPERNQPELVTLQPWMVLNGFYAAQPEFWIPTAQ